MRILEVIGLYLLLLGVARAEEEEPIQSNYSLGNITQAISNIDSLTTFLPDREVQELYKHLLLKYLR